MLFPFLAFKQLDKFSHFEIAHFLSFSFSISLSNTNTHKTLIIQWALLAPCHSSQQGVFPYHFQFWLEKIFEKNSLTFDFLTDEWKNKWLSVVEKTWNGKIIMKVGFKNY
jgi:hypothetical protein